MGVELGLRSSMSPDHGGTMLEVPREDHTNLMQLLR